MFRELFQQQPRRLSGNRFLFGVLLPIALEMLIVESYFFLKPGEELNIEALFIVGLSIFPLIFIYLFSPHLTFIASRVGKIYQKNLLQHIDEIFVAGTDPQHLIAGKLLPEERLVIRDQIRRTLIPMLSKQYKTGYIDSFGTRQEYSTEGQLLSYFEGLFLFSALSAVFNILNTCIVVYLSQNSISLNFTTIRADEISNPLNVVIFGCIFAGFTLTCLMLVNVSLGRLKELIPAVVPGVVFWEEEFKREERLAKMAALREFPAEKFLPRTASQNFAFMKEVYSKTLFDPFLDTIRWYVRDRVGKSMTWRLYEQVLDSIKISDIKKGFIEKAFFDIDMATAEVLAFDEKELRSIKFDIDFARSRLPTWNELSGEEKLTSFLFLYRSLETLFRNIIKEFGLTTEDSTFFGLLESLRMNEFLDTEEMRILGRIRRKRNLILHKSGEKINIEAEDISAFLMMLENVLERVERQLTHRQTEEGTEETITT
ncbi:MAG: hypothetical protein ACFFCQ_05890 [Promethearchaeota archaeon]